MNWISHRESLCVYITVTDEQLERIKSDPNYFVDEDFASECYGSTGENAVVVLIIIKDRKDIKVGQKELKKKYKSVSFWNRKHKKFYQWRKKCTTSQSSEMESSKFAMTP